MEQGTSPESQETKPRLLTSVRTSDLALAFTDRALAYLEQARTSAEAGRSVNRCRTDVITGDVRLECHHVRSAFIRS
jgi:hypothetical protein